MEPNSRNAFKPDCTLAELQARFENGYVPVRKKKRATEKQISIEEYLEDTKNER